MSTPLTDAALRSWAPSPIKRRLLEFVDRVSDATNESFVPPERRVAVFDLDGTLIIERPLHLEVLVAMDRLRRAAGADPSLADRQPYRSVLTGDDEFVRSHGADIVTAAAGGESLEAFHRRVRGTLRDDHPSLGRPYSALFYAPMIELMGLLRHHDFRVYVVSQSQQEYIRAFAESCLGVEPSFVIGSLYAFERDAENGFIRQGTVWEPYNRGEGKVLRIRERTGATPIFAFGNGRGDRDVLETVSRNDPGLVLFLDHDDADREFEYRSEPMLELANERGWQIVSMRHDFATMFRDDCLSSSQ